MLVYHSPPALVLTQSPRDLMPPPKDLLPMLTMAMDLDTTASVMLRLIPNFSMVDMVDMLDILMPMVSPILLTWDFVLTTLVLRCLARLLVIYWRCFYILLSRKYKHFSIDLISTTTKNYAIIV